MCKRKPAARRLREKALYCPFLKEGVRNVARSTVELPTFTFVRARAHSNPLSKRARLFPSAAYRRSAPPQLAVGILTPCGLGCFEVARWFCGAGKRTGFLFPVGVGSGLSPCGLGCFGVAWKFCGADNRLIFLAHSRRWAYSPLARWNASMQLVYFCNAKGQREFEFTLAFLASHEVCRRMAVFAIQPAGSRTRPASREACRRAAVKPRPTCMSPERPARLRRAVRGQGALPLAAAAEVGGTDAFAGEEGFAAAA